MCKLTATLLLSLYCLVCEAQLKTTNPLLAHSNAPIQFGKVDTTNIKEAVDAAIYLSDEMIMEIVKVPSSKRTFSNTMMAMDKIQRLLFDISSKTGLISSTYEQKEIRNTAIKELTRINNYSLIIWLNRELYNAVTEFSKLPEAGHLRPDQHKYLTEVKMEFEKNGMSLDDVSGEKLKFYFEKITFFGIQFDKNIEESKDSLELGAEQLTGVDSNIANSWKRANGKYIVTLNPPNYDQVILADDEAVRKMIFINYSNRAYPVNLKVLDSLLFYRTQFAKLLGFSSYAEYNMSGKMAKTTATVWNFENDLADKLKPYITSDMEELRNLKRKLSPNTADSFYAWDMRYYLKKLLQTKYMVDPDEVKQYFEIENTLKGMFDVYQRLFNIQIREVFNLPVWYKGVKSYEMYTDGKKAGVFYLDLYPRPDKFNHFACFPIQKYYKGEGREILPVAALICNFPEATGQMPSLLPHQDVITVFHEFGHLVHCMLGRADISGQSPFETKSDFVEAPSQFLENWCWEYDALKLFARHYKTGRILPEDLFEKMKKSQLAGISTQYANQLYYGMLDFTLSDKYDNIKENGLNQVSRDLYYLRQMPFPEGTFFICNFGHLSDYGAGYYGYLWSKVFAEDMFSVFKKNGVMHTPTGIKYRKEILEKAATKDELEMVRSFLGREPNSDAFLQSLGIK